MPEKLQSAFQRPIVRFLAAAGAVGVAFFLRETLTVGLGPDFPEYLLFYPTVMIVALIAGLWPALLAIIIAAALILIFWFVPGHPPLLRIGTSNFIGLALFMAVCTFISVVAELYRHSRLKAAAFDKEQAQRQAQEALRRQAEMLKLSFDAVIVRRSGGIIESWNRGAEELYGYSEAEALERDIRELRLDPAAQSVDELEQHLRGAGEWFGEAQRVTKDGRTVVVSSRQLVGRGMDGVERILEIDRDITDRKRVEEELRRAHDELEEKVARRTEDLQRANRTLLMVSACDQALVQISDERELTGVICQIIQDEGGYPLVWVGLLEDSGLLRCAASAGDQNGYLEKLRSTSGAAALRAGPVDTALQSKAPVVSEDLAAAPDRAPWKLEAFARGYRSMAALPLLNARTETIGTLVICSDRRFGFPQKELTLLKELADDLAFGISSLRARVERDLAQRSVEQKAAQLQSLAAEIVRTEQRERRRIARLLHDQIQQLLVATLYGLEGHHEGESTKPLSDLVRECIAVSRSLASQLSHPAFSEPDLYAALEWLGRWAREKYGLSVTVHRAQPVSASVEETRVTILEAARELLFNVVKHAGVREARIELDRTPAGDILVSVSDAGAGFDAASCFAPGRVSGGIGLFSIRERLEVIGGGMKIESDIGTGTRVSVWVPAELPSPSGETDGAAEAEGRASKLAASRSQSAVRGSVGKIRVLLVDDHAVVRDGIALQLLQQPDIEVVGEASAGTDAIELVRALRPDVVTMDVNMPGMNGVEAARAIHAEYPHTRIIGLSMSEEAEQAAAMKNAGAESYLSKSSSFETLLAAIRESSDRE